MKGVNKITKKSIMGNSGKVCSDNENSDIVLKIMFQSLLKN